MKLRGKKPIKTNKKLKAKQHSKWRFIPLIILGVGLIVAAAILFWPKSKTYVIKTDICLSNLKYPCYKDELLTITKHYGPEPALETLKQLEDSKKIPADIDQHQLAHEIGRETAKTYGINGSTFLRCSTEFNYGCQHGFFEYALGKATSAKDAISKICGTFESSPKYSSKFKFYCYHGVGHGVMMAQAYDLKAALDVCDSLPSQLGQDGCWQGVFMENVNSAMRGESRSGVFSTSDPLAPCNKVAQKYQQECFINHAGWLMNVFNRDVQKASSACLNASGQSIDTCLQSIGLMVTNPAWQASLSSTIPQYSFEDNASRACQQFPANYQDQCVIGGVSNILNFDQLNVANAYKFCLAVTASYQPVCYQGIGIGLRPQTNDTKVVLEKCAQLYAGEAKCREGAGL